jgi:integrase
MEKRKKQSSGANQFHFSQQPGSRYYSVRLMVGGKRRRFSTGETNLKAAQSKAVAIMADIKSRGFEAAVQFHGKRRDEIPTDPTIAEFCEIYQEAILLSDTPPSPISCQLYIRSLKRICEITGLRRISQLDYPAIEKFKQIYLNAAASPGSKPSSPDRANKKKTAVRDPASIRATLNGILRNAGAMFSKPLLQGYSAKGLTLKNPFADAKIKKVAIKAHSPFPQEVVDLIWTSSPTLRFGDPSAPAPDVNAPRRSTTSIDFRVPHPAAFLILLLEIGLGLRRNEADKAEWAWVIDTPDGRKFLEVRASDGFTPKSKQSRVIPIDPMIWKTLEEMKTDSRYIVPAPTSKAKRPGVKASTVYRCEEAHRVLVAWLRKAGITDRKPCHALRKEFGSYIATRYSLFHAQKLLGHSSPAVTSAYYASLTELPEISPSSMAKNS